MLGSGLVSDDYDLLHMPTDASRQYSGTQLAGHRGSTGGGGGHHYQRAGYTEPMEDKDEYGADRRDDHIRQPDRFSCFVLVLTVTSALGGFLFGYDTGVVSGAMLLIKDDFSLTDWQEEVVVSVTIVAAVTAAVCGGPAMERYGRRLLILLAAIIFTGGAVMLAAANSYETLVVGRCVRGRGWAGPSYFFLSVCRPFFWGAWR